MHQQRLAEEEQEKQVRGRRVPLVHDAAEVHCLLASLLSSRGGARMQRSNGMQHCHFSKTLLPKNESLLTTFLGWNQQDMEVFNREMGRAAQEARVDEYMRETTVNHSVLLDPTGVHVAQRFTRVHVANCP